MAGLVNNPTVYMKMVMLRGEVTRCHPPYVVMKLMSLLPMSHAWIKIQHMMQAIGNKYLPVLSLTLILSIQTWMRMLFLMRRPVNIKKMKEMEMPICAENMCRPSLALGPNFGFLFVPVVAPGRPILPRQSVLHSLSFWSCRHART